MALTQDMIVGLEKENMINCFKMKNYFLIPLILLGSVFVNAQDCLNHSTDNYGSDSANCRKNYTLYSSYFVQKNYNNASRFWWETQKICPTLKQINDNGRLVNINLYSNGAYIYKKIIKQKAKEKSPDLSLYKDTLYQIYDLWFANFGDCNSTKAALAKDIIAINDQKKFAKSYTLYRDVMVNEPTLLKSSDIKYFFAYTAVVMLKKKKITCEEFLSNYEMLSTICENNITTGNNPYKFSNVQNILDKKLGDTECASCDKLEEIYSSKYNADPENMDLTKKIFERLSNNKCTESNLYITLLDKVLNDPDNPPTAKDLYNAAVADYKRKEFPKAEERFNRAITICDDDKLNQKMYEILYDIAFNKKQYKKGF